MLLGTLLIWAGIAEGGADRAHMLPRDNRDDRSGRLERADAGRWIDCEPYGSAGGRAGRLFLHGQNGQSLHSATSKPTGAIGALGEAAFLSLISNPDTVAFKSVKRATSFSEESICLQGLFSTPLQGDSRRK